MTKPPGPVPDFVAAYAAGVYMFLCPPPRWNLVAEQLAEMGMRDGDRPYDPQHLARAASRWAARHLDDKVLSRRPLWPDLSPLAPGSAAVAGRRRGPSPRARPDRPIRLSRSPR